MSRFAIFYNPHKREPWSVVCQVRVCWIWIRCYATTYSTEEVAREQWRRLVDKELDKRAKGGDGEKRSGWQP